MDDVVHLIERGASKAVRRLVRELQDENAYGKSLQLLRTSGGEAFGFRWSLSRNRVTVEQEPKWVRSFKSTFELEPLGLMYEGEQVDTRQQRRGVLTGYIFRPLDMTNKSEDAALDAQTSASGWLAPLGRAPASDWFSRDD